MSAPPGATTRKYLALANTTAAWPARRRSGFLVRGGGVGDGSGENASSPVDSRLSSESVSSNSNSPGAPGDGLHGRRRQAAPPRSRPPRGP